MSALQGLLKKDYGISKFWFLFWLGFIAVFLIVPLLMELYFKQPASFLPIAVVMLLGSHAFFLPGMLLSMLHLEGKTQLWLYNPQSSKSLLVSKVVVCLVYQLIAQVFLTGAGLTVYQFNKHQFFIETSDLIIGITVLNVGLLLFALYVSCWTIFYWSVYHYLGKFLAIKNWRWLALLLLFFLSNVIFTFLTKIAILKEIVTKWKIPVLMGANFEYKQGGWEIYLNGTDLPVLLLLLHALFAFCLFLISCWLLDRKVEV